jgi:hypothetical protein
MRGPKRKKSINFRKTLVNNFTEWYDRKVVQKNNGLSADDTTPQCKEMCSQAWSETRDVNNSK